MMTFDEAHVVIKRGDIVRLRNELDSGFDANLTNAYSWSVLMLAAISGNTVIGQMLIERGAALDTRHKSGGSALSLAIETGHPSFVKLLLDHGASMNCGRNDEPLENSFDAYEKYTVARHCIGRIRQIFQAEREKRSQCA